MEAGGLRGRHLVWLLDYTGEEIQAIIDVARDFKRRLLAGERTSRALRGRTVAMIFEKPSTRTRVSLEVAVWQLGGRPIYLGWSELQLGRGESIEDTGRVLSRYVDAIVARVGEHSKIVRLAGSSRVPVINALSDLVHPLQALADMMTIEEKKGRVRGVTIAFVGDGSDNVLHSLLIAGSKLGANIRVASPRALRPDPRILGEAYRASEESGSTIELLEDPYEAVRGADIVYTDVWVSMGREAEREERVRLLEGYRVDQRLMDAAGDKALFMHCLPAFRGQEVAGEVIDGPRSIVWDQAENRLHTGKAVLALLVP